MVSAPEIVDDGALYKFTFYLLTYLLSCKASPRIGWYQIILLGDRGTNMPRVALNSRAAGIRTRDLLIASLAAYRYATEPHLLCVYTAKTF